MGKTDGPRHEAMRAASVGKGREKIIGEHTTLMAERSEEMIGETLLEDLLIAYQGRRVAVVFDQDGNNVTGLVVDGRGDGFLLQLDHSGKLTYIALSAVWGVILDAEQMAPPSRSRKGKPPRTIKAEPVGPVKPLGVGRTEPDSQDAS